MCAGQCICTEWNLPGVHFQRGECYLPNQPECSSGKVMSINLQKNGEKIIFCWDLRLTCNIIVFITIDPLLRPPRGAYSFSTHLSGGGTEYRWGAYFRGGA